MAAYYETTTSSLRLGICVIAMLLIAKIDSSHSPKYDCWTAVKLCKPTWIHHRLAVKPLVKKHNLIIFTGRCDYSGNPNNGYATNANFTRGKLVPHGSKVEFACDVSYTLAGSIVLHCNDGSWNGRLPSCKGRYLKKMAEEVIRLC